MTKKSKIYTNNCQNNINKAGKTKFQLIILSNSPGELTCWVMPVIKSFKELLPDSEISIYLLPCQYASSNEYKIAAAIPDVDIVLHPKETISELFSRPFIHKKIPGAVLSLGGDPFYATLFGWKYKIPNYVYSEHNISNFLHTYVFKKNKVGDLMAARLRNFKPDRKELLKKYNLPDCPHSLFLCGSRPQHFFNLLPIIKDTVIEINKKRPDFSAILLISPFIKEAEFNDISQKHDLSLFRIIKADTNTKSEELMALSDLIVTIPGTNTAEAMYVGTPLLITIPLNKPEALIFDGLAGILVKLPIFGKILTSLVIKYLKKQKKHFALPNIILDQKVVPEIIDYLKPDIFCNQILEIFESQEKLQTQRKLFSSKKIDPEVDKLIAKQIINGNAAIY